MGWGADGLGGTDAHDGSTRGFAYPGYTKAGPPVPGTGRIEGVIEFCGHIFAARSGMIYRAIPDGWEEVCLTSHNR